MVVFHGYRYVSLPEAIVTAKKKEIDRCFLSNSYKKVLLINNNHHQLVNYELVGGFKHFYFSIVYGAILPIDELIFFKMVKATKQ